ncbi:hypothetical protein [Streptomyces sp. NPDC005907]|uniref:hypothetical protein n=1 Tax=Streptomyces sp. NPDC005907 TaxID=3154571 RepID=UPI0033EFD777
MGTGGTPRAAVALGLVPALALLTGTLITGCGKSGSESTATASTTSASASATPPEDLCTRLVAHWSREVLDDNTYGDYQSMGLSNGQYEILRHVVDAARTERKRQNPTAARELIDREARKSCAAWYRTGGPADGPWQ